LEFHKSDVKLVDDFWGLEACEEACNAKEECAGFEVVRYYKDVRGNQLNPTESYCSFLDRLSFDCERDNGFYVDHGMQTWCFKKPNEPKVPIDPQLAAQKCVAACPMWEEHSECFRDNVFCTVTEKCKDRAAELLCCLFEEQAETCADAVKYMEDPDGGAGGLWAMPSEQACMADLLAQSRCGKAQPGGASSADVAGDAWRLAAQEAAFTAILGDPPRSSLAKRSDEELEALARATGVDLTEMATMSREEKIAAISERRESALRTAAVSAGVAGAETMPAAQLAEALKAAGRCFVGGRRWRGLASRCAGGGFHGDFGGSREAVGEA
jgi:hypothetical protein